MKNKNKKRQRCYFTHDSKKYIEKNISKNARGENNGSKVKKWKKRIKKTAVRWKKYYPGFSNLTPGFSKLTPGYFFQKKITQGFLTPGFFYAVIHPGYFPTFTENHRKMIPELIFAIISWEFHIIVKNKVDNL